MKNNNSKKIDIHVNIRTFHEVRNNISYSRIAINETRRTYVYICFQTLLSTHDRSQFTDDCGEN